MKTIFGALLLIGDWLLNIPITIWILAFIVYIVYSVINKKTSSTLFMILNMLFYFVIINYTGIASNFIDCFGLGLLIPIVLMLVIPYAATILTSLILKILFR